VFANFPVLYELTHGAVRDPHAVRGTHFDYRWGKPVCGWRDGRVRAPERKGRISVEHHPNHPQPEPDEAPETPLDEPSPTPVKDPPADPGPRAPYVVEALRGHIITRIQ
jgi:hypothetical protein